MSALTANVAGQPTGRVTFVAHVVVLPPPPSLPLLPPSVIPELLPLLLPELAPLPLPLPEFDPASLFTPPLDVDPLLDVELLLDLPPLDPDPPLDVEPVPELDPLPDPLPELPVPPSGLLTGVPLPLLQAAATPKAKPPKVNP